MIPVSNQAIATRLTNGDTVKCDFSIKFITMSLDIDSSDIWEGGVEFDDSVSSDSEFQFGTAIINKCTITINNNTGKFDSYEFENQHLEISAFLINPDDPTEYADINKGCYIVNEATYTDNLITLECYDRMFLFDEPYDDATCEYPATLDEIVQSACFDLTPSYIERPYDYSKVVDLNNWTQEEVQTNITYSGGVNTFSYTFVSGEAEKLRIPMVVKPNTNYTLSMEITTGDYEEYVGVRDGVTYEHHTYIAVAKNILLLHEPLDFQQSSLLASKRIYPNASSSYNLTFNTGSLQKVYIYLDLSAVVDDTTVNFTVSNIVLSDGEISSSDTPSSSGDTEIDPVEEGYTEESDTGQESQEGSFSGSGTDTIFGSFQSDLKDITINRKPQTGTTYREVISWAAQITGCFARFNSEGKLDLKWFPNSPNGSVLSVFNKSLSKHTYSVTGVRATYKLYAENEEVLYGNEITSEPVIEVIPDSALETLDEKEVETAYNEVFTGTEGYVVELKDNEFLSSENVHAVVYYLYNKIHGFTVRRATVTNIGNILIEAGDYINVQDTKHNSVIPIRITGVRYTSGGSQTLTSAGESASISATVGNSVETRNYMNNANRATQIEYNIAREFDKDTQYKNGDYTTYNNLFYKYVGDEEEEIEDDDDFADWEQEVNTGDNGDDGNINEPIIFNATPSSTPRLLGSGGSSNLLGADNDVTVETGSDVDKNGFDKSKWQRIVLTDELFFQLARRIARPYTSGKGYEKGDFVYYEKNFYECNEDITQSGDFDDSKWKKIIISDYLNKKQNDWWVGSESEYDGLETHEENVIYFIYEDEA